MTHTADGAAAAVEPEVDRSLAVPVVERTRVRVRYAETDQMGFANHANYFAWFEIGRTDFIRRLGTSYADLEHEGVLLPVVEAAVRYQNAAHYDDTLRIDTRLLRVQSRAVSFAYEVYRIDPGPEIRVATATVKLVALDANGSPRTLPTGFLRKLHRVACDPSAPVD